MTAWRHAAASHKAEAQKHCQQHVAVCLALEGTAGAQSPASEAGWAVQMAFQGWRAVVLHMAARRGQLQQAALASAERAIQRGCHAACGLTDVSNPPSIDVATDPSVQLSFPGHQGEYCIPVEQEWEHNLRHTHLVGFVQTSESSLMEVAAATVHQDAAELTAAFFKASAHWAEQLQARVLHAWRELSRQAIASVWQQHELKVAANQQLLQVSPADSPCLTLVVLLLKWLLQVICSTLE